MIMGGAGTGTKRPINNVTCKLDMLFIMIVPEIGVARYAGYPRFRQADRRDSSRYWHHRCARIGLLRQSCGRRSGLDDRQVGSWQLSAVARLVPGGGSAAACKEYDARPYLDISYCRVH